MLGEDRERMIENEVSNNRIFAHCYRFLVLHVSSRFMPWQHVDAPDGDEALAQLNRINREINAVMLIQSATRRWLCVAQPKLIDLPCPTLL